MTVYEQEIRAMVRAAGAVWLKDLPEVEPSPAQLALFIRARERAGLALPPFRLRWVRGWRGAAMGETVCDVDGWVVLSLRADLTPRDLFETALHELKHASDFVAGPDRYSADELEARAHAFVAQILEQDFLRRVDQYVR